MVHIDHLKPFEKAFEPSIDNLRLPSLILDEDYLDLVIDKDHKDYLEFLEPLLDKISEAPELSESEPRALIRVPAFSPMALRCGKRSVKPPRRYGYSSNPMCIESVYWF